MPQHTIIVTDEEYKALAWGIADPPEWIDNFVHERARQFADAIILMALDDFTHTILNEDEKRQLVTALADLGIIINTVEGLPDNIKTAIIQKARIKSAAERQAESEAERA